MEMKRNMMMTTKDNGQEDDNWDYAGGCCRWHQEEEEGFGIPDHLRNTQGNRK